MYDAQFIQEHFFVLSDDVSETDVSETNVELWEWLNAVGERVAKTAHTDA